MRDSINIALQAYCACVYLVLGIVHLCPTALLLSTRLLFYGWPLPFHQNAKQSKVRIKLEMMVDIWNHVAQQNLFKMYLHTRI